MIPGARSLGERRFGAADRSIAMLHRIHKKLRNEGVGGLASATLRRARMRAATLFRRGPAKYVAMQRAYYTDVDPFDDVRLRNVIIGHYEEHERYPYERFLLDGIESPRQSVALDFGCGPGRMILRMSRHLGRVDGVDISPRLIQACRRWTAGLKPPPRLYVNDGGSLAPVPDGVYDLVFCTIAFHHIASHPVRRRLIGEFHRVLKTSGRLALQMVFTDQPRAAWQRHADWLDDAFDAGGTNSECDVRITPENLPQVRRSFEEAGFRDFRHALAPLPHALPDATNWIFLYARKGSAG